MRKGGGRTPKPPPWPTKLRSVERANELLGNSVSESPVSIEGLVTVIVYGAASSTCAEPEDRPAARELSGDRRGNLGQRLPRSCGEQSGARSGHRPATRATSHPGNSLACRGRSRSPPHRGGQRLRAGRSRHGAAALTPCADRRTDRPTGPAATARPRFSRSRLRFDKAHHRGHPMARNMRGSVSL